MPQDWEPTDWGEEQAKRVADAIIQLRGSYSTQWLADRTKELGHPISRSVIADLENGRRRYVTTAELMMLARALNTTPIALLYPDPLNDDEIKMLPTPADVTTSRTYALQWFSGLVDVPLPWICDDGGEYLANLKPVETARQIWELEGQKSALMKQGLDKTGKEKREILYAIAEIQRQIDKLRGTDGG